MGEVHGWVLRRREHGRIAFLDIKSIEFPGKILQVVFREDVCGRNVLEIAKRVPLESSVVISGELKENPSAPDGLELLAKKIEVVQESEDFPLAPKEHGVEAIMKYRHLAVRLPRYQKIWMVREKVMKYFREWFEKNGWHEVSPPIIVKTACEGGATLFRMDWFGDVAFLSQSAQLYLEALIFSLGRVWSLTPSFRAEKSRTKRHLSEYWHLEAEAAFMRFDGILDVEEELVRYTVKKLIEDENSLELIKKFRDDIEVLKRTVEEEFPRIKYDEALEILKRKGYEVEWGEDLGSEEERVLSMEFDRPLFVTHYPTRIKAFYVKELDERPEVCLSADLLLPEGYGEVTTGGERETDIEKMKERLKKEGIENFEDYEWYFDLRRYGSVPHSGFGLGIERFVRWLLKIDHIRDTIPFPRMAREKRFI